MGFFIDAWIKWGRLSGMHGMPELVSDSTGNIILGFIGIVTATLDYGIMVTEFHGAGSDCDVGDLVEILDASPTPAVGNTTLDFTCSTYHVNIEGTRNELRAMETNGEFGHNDNWGMPSVRIPVEDGTVCNVQCNQVIGALARSKLTPVVCVLHGLASAGWDFVEENPTLAEEFCSFPNSSLWFHTSPTPPG